MSTSPRPVRDAVVLPAAPDSVGVARRWMTVWLADHGVGPEHVCDAVLALSELVSNVVRHGSGDVVCHASMLDPTHCCVEVIDDSPGRPHVVSRRADAVGGLGLHIVERLAADWGVTDLPGGKAVWAVVPVGPGAPEAP